VGSGAQAGRPSRVAAAACSRGPALLGQINARRIALCRRFAAHDTVVSRLGTGAPLLACPAVLRCSSLSRCVPRVSRPCSSERGLLLRTVTDRHANERRYVARVGGCESSCSMQEMTEEALLDKPAVAPAVTALPPQSRFDRAPGFPWANAHGYMLTPLARLKWPQLDTRRRTTEDGVRESDM